MLISSFEQGFLEKTFLMDGSIPLYLSASTCLRLLGARSARFGWFVLIFVLITALDRGDCGGWGARKRLAYDRPMALKQKCWLLIGVRR